MHNDTAGRDDEDILKELQQIALQVLEEAGFNDEPAQGIALQLIDQVRGAWGGQQIYIRKCEPGALSKRDLEIYHKFNGRNHQQLAKQHDLTPAQVYRILRTVGQSERERRQRSLPLDD